MAGSSPAAHSADTDFAEDDRVPVGQRRVDEVRGRLAWNARRTACRPARRWPRRRSTSRAAAPSMPISSSRVPQSGSMARSCSICPAPASTSSALSAAGQPLQQHASVCAPWR